MAALPIPCFWQSRIQSADLGSHIYNAWLVTLIHQGAAPGLWIAPQSNNILFDLILDWLFVHVGPDWAQRLAVSLAVLIFGGGALLFIFRVGARNWWFAAPCVAMLSYGFIFHIGFFNFYLSLGLCLWYLATFWNASWRTRVVAAPLLALAWLAHPFPVVWAVGIAAYAGVANTRRRNGRIVLLVVGMAALISLRFVLTHRYPYQWSAQQIFFVTGADQLETFGAIYIIPFAGLLFIWLRKYLQLVRREGAAYIFFSISFQLWLLNAAAILLIPNFVMFPRFALPFGYITTRLSLGAALLACATLSNGRCDKLDKIMLIAIALLFFGLLYHDDRELNELENRMDTTIQTLRPFQRVISKLGEPSLRRLCFQHDLDRACIGHCFSYGNYEPASRQFRLRASSGNGIVLSDYSDVDAVRMGRYTVQARDLPIQSIYACGADLKNICSHALSIGEMSGNP